MAYVVWHVSTDIEKQGMTTAKMKPTMNEDVTDVSTTTTAAKLDSLTKPPIRAQPSVLGKPAAQLPTTQRTKVPGRFTIHQKGPDRARSGKSGVHTAQRANHPHAMPVPAANKPITTAWGREDGGRPRDGQTSPHLCSR
ncbi:hypothetical protein F5144DRAFT_566297 [Chaetomium tenue]|uniref:Uncharacterized protein n=1 Tax=Chaetomium tenue TaxID=1854479 RepID=A0ACB7PGD4_9PEZI|nr:hypothetical protein F5144DRAFT_566297 [Chaetomium globosum]